MHYYQFNIGDYIKRTHHLTNLEDLAYRRLIDLYYTNESPMPDDVKQLARLVSLRENTEEISVILNEFFRLDNGFWHNKRADEEIAIYHSKADVARANGKKGGRPKKPSTNPEETQPVILANPEETGSKAKHKPLTNKQETITSKQLEPKDLSPKADDRVQHVFNYWCSVFNKSTTAKLTKKRIKAVTDRLKEGYTFEQIKQAIDGCSQSEYHMGKNDTRAIYNDLELICRSGEKVEQFESNYKGAQQVQQYSTTTQQNIINAQGFINGE